LFTDVFGTKKQNRYFSMDTSKPPAVLKDPSRYHKTLRKNGGDIRQWITKTVVPVNLHPKPTRKLRTTDWNVCIQWMHETRSLL